MAALILCDVCGRGTWEKRQCALCMSWAEKQLDHSEPPIHVIVPKALANEIGGQWKIPSEGGFTHVYHLTWVRNGRALYTFMGALEGLGAGRV